MQKIEVGYYPRQSVPYDYALVVIGSGPAGERGAVTAARLGKRVLLLDRGPQPGGAAVHTGTLPSETLRDPSVLAAGDVIGFPAPASTSMEQGRLATIFAFDAEQEALTVYEGLLPHGIYAIPEASCVGLSEEDAEAKGVRTAVGLGDFDHDARARINGSSAGFVKLVFDRASKQLIGAHSIGDRAAELVHIGQALIGMKASVFDIAYAVFNYPTLSECYKQAACDALNRWPE